MAGLSFLRRPGAAVSADLHKASARRIIVRIALFTLILTAMHFVFVLHNGPSCAEGHICVFSNGHGVSLGMDGSGWGLPPLSTSYVSEDLKPRYNFKSYEQYLQLQIKKTLNPKLRKLWTSKDWRRKVDVFAHVFQDLVRQNMLKTGDKALCIGARVGQEVLALKEVGVEDSIGIDLVPSPPLVIQGDMHRLPFEPGSFDFVFSNAFDHALFPAMFAAEVMRVLKPGGVMVLHLALKKRTDRYSANDLHAIDPLLHLFQNFDVVHVKDVDAFGLDCEIVLKKHVIEADRNKDQALKCAVSKARQKLVADAEPLIVEEPLKPWITLKENAKKIKYLPSLIDISDFRQYIYVDVGARSYGSSIGSWFIKKYPKQNRDFSIYAIEADKSFAGDYSNRKNVQFLPYAAWVRNETLVFGANPENRAAEGEIGMGRIQSIAMVANEAANVLKLPSEKQLVQGFDFSEWLKEIATPDDFVVLKMDVEGAEFELLPRMFQTGAICLVDELLLECHYNRWQRTSPKRTSKYSRTYKECLSLLEALRNNGVLVHQWW